MPGVRTSRRTRLGLTAAASLAALSGLVPFAATADPLTDLLGAVDGATPDVEVIDRPGAVPIVMTGAQLPSWSQPASVPVLGEPNPVAGIRDAHAGTTIDPPVSPTAARPDRIAAFRWTGDSWDEIPVQVDERFPYFLRNDHSDFGIYSQTDMELTYAWDVESWKKIAGECTTEYPPGESAMADPVPTLDDDDEIAFMPDDAGERAPLEAFGPVGTDGVRQEIAVTDPLAPGSVSYVYLFTRDGGSSFDRTNGYVRYERDANADQWVDRTFWPAGHPESLGTSNTGYGPNLSGTVCPDGTPASSKSSTDRFPRDGVTVSTDAYRWTATGRWMVRGMQVAKPGQPGVYGPDLVDRWKGRAFQQSPDSTISLVGFEDEQVNWEANSALIGERAGPVRAIREVWGADSGTNVTKTETFYRDAVTYRYRLRVHPIPPDGLYTSWDYNAGVATRYFTPIRPEGVTIDGENDEIPGLNVDSLAGMPAFFDAPDPTLNVPLSLLTWEQVSGVGDSGSLVYLFENKGPTSLTEPTVVPYYRDDACLDDGTGDDPVPRPYPGEASTDARVRAGYAALAGKPYAELTCEEKQGAYGSHGVHFFVTGDTDNAFLPSPQPINEVDAQQWQFAVPTAAPTNVGEPYSTEVRIPRVAVATPQPSTPMTATATRIDAPEAVQATDSFTAVVHVDGAPAGASVDVSYAGETASAATGANGRAVVELVARTVGSSVVTASYRGDEAHAASSADHSIEVVHEAVEASIAIGGPRRLPTITGRLVDDDGTPVAGVDVDFIVDGAVVATRTTDADGVARLAAKLKRRSTVEVRFTGDAVHSAASASTTFS